MKICQNCGMEYGDDNPFCPFCDERYGNVILVDDVISADGLPPYKEEFHVIGEISVKQESFADNRDKIYKRNIRLAAKENFLPKMEARAAYKPVVPLAEIGRDGVIAPYKPPNPVVKKFKNIRTKIKAVKLSKTGKTVLGVLFVFAVFFAVIGFSWYETTDTYADYQQAKMDREYEKIFPDWNETYVTYTENAEETDDANIEYSYIYGKDGAVKASLSNIPEKIVIEGEDGLKLDLSYVDMSSVEGICTYAFEFTNTTDENLLYFCNKFIGAEHTDKFTKVSVLYPNGEHCFISWRNGAPSYTAYSGIDEHGRNTTVPPYVCSHDTVSGFIDIDFRED